MDLKERLELISKHISKYDLDSGKIWGKSGKLISGKNSRGYIVIGGPYIDKNPIYCLCHQLIYFLSIGEAIEGLDHKDMDKGNNSIWNLRKSSKRENNLNSLFSINSKGYSFNKNRNKYRVQITVNNKRIHGGYFSKERDAINQVIKLRSYEKQGPKE